MAQVFSVSDKWLLIFSQDPTFRPSREAADRALCTFKSMGGPDDEILAEFYEQTEFHSGFQNWSGVTCPYCASAIEDWFFDSTSASFKRSGFANLEAVTPCCHSNVSLNDVAFTWPAGFSLFALKAVNCGIMPTPHQIDEIEEALGTRCRVIWERL